MPAACPTVSHWKAWGPQSEGPPRHFDCDSRGQGLEANFRIWHMSVRKIYVQLCMCD